jgi:hypothetical protein
VYPCAPKQQRRCRRFDGDLCGPQPNAHRVVGSANRMLKKIGDSYLEPNKKFPELRQMSDSGLIDLLRDFSEACREEFRLRNSTVDR